MAPRAPRAFALATACAAVALALAARPGPARANGLITHVYVADTAVAHLPPGPLRDILRDPANLEAYRAGSIYPDTGYGVRDDYGEWSHWEPFLEAYMRHLRATYAPPYDAPEARPRVAFLMGCAAHVMSDQVFDALFMARTRERDGVDSNLDIGSDSWLIVEHGARRDIAGYLPGAELTALYQREMRREVPESLIREGMRQVQMGMRAVNLFAPSWYEDYWREMRWAASHYMNSGVPGSFPYLSRVIAGHWQVLWARLLQAADPGASLLMTYPLDGASNVPVDGSTIETRFAAVFGYGLDPATATAANVRLVGPDGAPVAADVQPWRTNFSNVLLVRPRASLAHDARYRLEIDGAAMRTISGETFGRAFTVGFRTRCAPGREADCPPLDAPWTPPADPPARDAGRARPDGGAVAPQDAAAWERDAGADAGIDAGRRDVVARGGCGCRAAGEAAPRASAGAALAALGAVAFAFAGARARARRRTSRRVPS